MAVSTPPAPPSTPARLLPLHAASAQLFHAEETHRWAGIESMSLEVFDLLSAAAAAAAAAGLPPARPPAAAGASRGLKPCSALYSSRICTWKTKGVQRKSSSSGKVM
jgi:hypothetical protein